MKYISSERKAQEVSLGRAKTVVSLELSLRGSRQRKRKGIRNFTSKGPEVGRHGLQKPLSTKEAQEVGRGRLTRALCTRQRAHRLVFLVLRPCSATHPCVPT